MDTVLLTLGGVALGAAAAWWLATARRKKTSHHSLSTDAALAALVRVPSPAHGLEVVFGFLRDQYQCDRILFLGKHRRFLQVDALHGLPESIRQDIRIQYQPSMVRACVQSFEPRTIDHLRGMAPEQVWRSIQNCRFSHCMPVFWGEHVYGLLLIHIPESRHGEVKQLSAIAQALAAVYHLQWSRQSAARTAGDPSATTHENDVARPARQILKLVRHRNPETVVRKLISAAQSDIGLERFVCVYEPREKGDELQLVAGGIDRAVKIPGQDQFEGLVDMLSSDKPTSVSPLSSGSGAVSDLGKAFVDEGISHAVLFHLSPERRGIFAWSDKKPAELVTRRLSVFRGAAEDLLENAESFEKIEELSQTDSLTGLYNHRYFQLRLAEEVNRARRYKRSLGLVMIDLDLLKSINDVHGHQVGDAILQQVGAVLKSSVREIDVIARYGGDEFCVIMPEADQGTCELFMARLRSELAAKRFQSPNTEQTLTCTISLGAAVFPELANDAQKLVFGADMALLKAKEQGRNTFVVFGQK
ncbi:MAG: GGDEF domain-containing protein [candidate division Zixibacteria bacterium]|nr:GGDEF domain-containing protein [candidate division Zixibacteria bacterium]